MTLPIPFMLATNCEDLGEEFWELYLHWIWSEKYDGYRARWCSKRKMFISRSNKEYKGAPQWFKYAVLPNINLDGELWAGRENFESMGVVRRLEPDEKDWIPIKYVVYDLPDLELPFEERVKKLRIIIKNTKVRWNIIRKELPEPFKSLECPIIMAPQNKIGSVQDMKKIYNDIILKGGEGVIIKHPEKMYENGRSKWLLKCKPQFDEEAIIVDYKPGKGKYEGLLGGFVCQPLINCDTYHVIDHKEEHGFTTSGMDDEVRVKYKETHPIGTIISYTHNGKTNIGKPRFARYVRVRDDIIIKDNIESNSFIKRDSIINIFNELFNYEKVNGNVFKANAYQKAIKGLRGIKADNELTEMNLLSIDGIGDSLYKKIDDIIKNGTCDLYEKIKGSDDIKAMELFTGIYAIGSKKAGKLIEMGYRTIDDLRNIKNKSEVFTKSQLLGIKYYEDIKERIPRNEVQKHEKILKDMLFKVDKNAELTIAGSYRRNKDSSGDIDVLLKADNEETFQTFIKRLKKMAYLIDDLVKGKKKYNGISKVGHDGIGRRIDIMYTKPSEYPFAILYFTGSGDFNKMMRKLVHNKNLKINEYCLTDIISGEPIDHVFKEEKDIFDYLEMGYVEPWKRL